MRKFIADGNKIKVTLRFRGRELSYKEAGLNLLNRVIEDLQEISKCDVKPKLEDRQMIMMLSSTVSTTK